MTRICFVLAAGLCAAFVGAVVALMAGSLATDWQPLNSGGGWGGLTDPALRRTYTTLGLSGVVFGLALTTMAMWAWLADGRPAPQHPGEPCAANDLGS